jgi:aminoglycoside 3-N-acetyltransferase
MKKLLKGIYYKIKQVKREREIKKLSEGVSRERIIADLGSMGIEKGDVLFLHSSLKNIGYVDGGPDTVVNAILEAIGDQGTLIVPTYSMIGTMYHTCIDKSFVFDPRKDTKGLGAIPSSVLKLDGVEISIHPTHCVSAIGKEARFITEAHHNAASTFGKGSPWERFLGMNGKLLGLGVSMGPITFYHLLEDLELDSFPLPVRMEKTYLVKCINWEGELIEVPVNPLDPELAKSRIDQASREDLRDYFFEDFLQANIIRSGHIGLAKSWIASSQEFYGHLRHLMNQGITIYASPEDLHKRPHSSVTLQEPML